MTKILHTFPAVIDSVPVQAPFGLWQTALLFKRVHRIWQFFIRVPVYTNPDNFLGLGAGYLLNFVLGNNRFLKLPAVPFLIGVRLLDLFEQEDAFRKSCRDLKEAFLCVQPITLMEQLPRLDDRSPKTVQVIWRMSVKRLYIRIQRIAASLLHFCKETFYLVMRIMDVLELITFDPKRLQKLVDLSVQEGAINVSRCFQALALNQSALILRLEGKKGTINSLLKQMGAKTCTADHVVNYAKTAIQRLHDWAQAYQTLSTTVGTLLTGESKRPKVIVPPRVAIKVAKVKNF